MLASDAGRARFWAESAIERDGAIDFIFPNGLTWRGAVLAAHPPYHFSVRYFANSRVTFELSPDGNGGVDLSLSDAGVPEADRLETTAGWVSVLLSLKAACDFAVDLRSHDPARTWDDGYCDN
ncbi:MAG: hypothetical protein DCC58_08165 [Chloroflexi bacterium]|nr:MAG: hypothetical protein DCC58_08165 [Chloroflexota bacterium]